MILGNERLTSGLLPIPELSQFLDCRRFVRDAKLSVDALFKTLFSIASIDRDFHTREAMC